jgi:hypothetical protein
MTVVGRPQVLWVDRPTNGAAIILDQKPVPEGAAMLSIQPVSRLASILSVIFVAMVSLSLEAAIAEKPEQTELPQPTRGQLPGDVVRIVIEALAQNDEPYADAGIATTFAFASPANKVNTGPLLKFTQMVRTPAYGIMIDHVEHEFSEVVLMESDAYQMVRIRGMKGDEAIFAFRLSQQAGGKYDGMWMTDAVWPVASGDIPEQAF